MALKQIPLDIDQVAYSFKVDLDNRPFVFELTFNSRASLWTMTIKNESDETLIAGIPIHVKQDLLRQFRYDARLPQGVLMALNVVDGVSDPGLENFGDQVVLVYDEVTE
jgi:hypothetical protein